MPLVQVLPAEAALPGCRKPSIHCSCLIIMLCDRLLLGQLLNSNKKEFDKLDIFLQDPFTLCLGGTGISHIPSRFFSAVSAEGPSRRLI